MTFESSERGGHSDFPLTTKRASWYALVVEDRLGRKAYSNPIWIDVVDYPLKAESR